MDPKYILKLLTTKAELNTYRFIELANVPDDTTFAEIIAALKERNRSNNVRLNFIAAIYRQISIGRDVEKKRKYILKIHFEKEIDNLALFLEKSTGLMVNGKLVRVKILPKSYKYVRCYLPYSSVLYLENKLPKFVMIKLNKSMNLSTIIPSDCLLEVLAILNANLCTKELYNSMIGMSLKYSDTTNETNELMLAYDFDVDITSIVQKLKMAGFDNAEPIASKMFLVPGNCLAKMTSGVTEEPKMVNIANEELISMNYLTNGSRQF